MDKRNLNECLISGVTYMTPADKIINDAKIAAFKPAITTQIDTDVAHFTVCAYCTGVTLNRVMEVKGGANVDLKVKDTDGITDISQDVARPIKLGAPTDLGNNYICSHCGENPITPKRSDVPKYDYGNDHNEINQP